MSYIGDKILQLTRQLYPTGRAFKMPDGSYFEKLHKALAVSEEQAFNDARSVLDSAIPDNDNFTADDAKGWERRLGLITNEAVALSDRKLAIQRKYNHPGSIPARQNYRFLEKQLQDAGFDVYVYENRFPDGMGGFTTDTPESVSGVTGDLIQYGQFQYGQSRYGVAKRNMIANYIDENIDWKFNVGSSLRATFFIGGNPIGSFADVDVNRKDEFRQLILKAKPVQCVGFLFINYV
jgi:uncharacterized protein YmfQ (DUF2313 family)